MCVLRLWASDVWGRILSLLCMALDVIVQLDKRFGLWLGLDVHEIISRLSVLRDQRLLKLLVNLWVGVDSSWGWLESSWVCWVDLS